MRGLNGYVRRIVDFSLIGARQQVFRQGWTHETLVTFLGSTRVDATMTSGPDPSIKVVAIFGSTTIRVPIGSRIQLEGFTLVGSRSLEVRSGEGPEIAVRSYSLLGSVSVTDSP